MGTVRDLLSSSMRLIGALASGESLASSEAQDALTALNSMLGGWNTQKLTIYAQTREVFPLVSGQSSYKIGPIADDPTVDFNTVRPMKIVNATLQRTAGETYETPLMMLDPDQWAAKSNKTAQSDPSEIFAQGTYPADTLYFYPVPAVAQNVVLYSLKPRTSFTDLNEVLSLPNGYDRALKFNLAVELAPEYGKQLDPTVYENAKESLGDIKRMNQKPMLLTCDPALLRASRFDILKGDA